MAIINSLHEWRVLHMVEWSLIWPTWMAICSLETLKTAAKRGTFKAKARRPKGKAAWPCYARSREERDMVEPIHQDYCCYTSESPLYNSCEGHPHTFKIFPFSSNFTWIEKWKKEVVGVNKSPSRKVLQPPLLSSLLMHFTWDTTYPYNFSRATLAWMLTYLIYVEREREFMYGM